MAKYGPSDVTVTIEDAPGGTAQNIENFILNGISVEVLSEMFRSDALGDAWQEFIPAGKRSVAPVTIEGIFDDTTTTGVHDILRDVDDGPNDDGRELVIQFAGGAANTTFTIDVRVARYQVSASNDEPQQFAADIQPTGAGVWS